MCDPIDRDLPPAFPPWMRRLDPLLAAEDTNPIFEAFRRRGLAFERYASGWASRLQTAALGLAVLLFAVVLVKAGPMWGLLTLAALFVGFFVVLGRRHEDEAHRRLPLSIHEAMMFEHKSDVPTQLLLIGATARTWGEAYYLEASLSTRLHGFIVFPILWLVLGVVGHLLLMLLHVGPAGLLTLLAWLWFLIEGLRSFFITKSLEVLERGGLGGDLPAMPHAIGLGCPAAVVILLMFVAGLANWSILDDPSRWDVVYAAFQAACTSCFALLARRTRRRGVQMLITQADEAFEQSGRVILAKFERELDRASTWPR